MLPPSLRYCYTVWGIFYLVEILPLSVTSSCSFSVHQPLLSAATLSGIITTCGAQVNYLWYSHAVACIVGFPRTDSMLQLSIFSFSWLSGSKVLWLLFSISWSLLFGLRYSSIYIWATLLSLKQQGYWQKKISLICFLK